MLSNKIQTYDEKISKTLSHIKVSILPRKFKFLFCSPIFKKKTKFSCN